MTRTPIPDGQEPWHRADPMAAANAARTRKRAAEQAVLADLRAISADRWNAAADKLIAAGGAFADIGHLIRQPGMTGAASRQGFIPVNLERAEALAQEVSP